MSYAHKIANELGRGVFLITGQDSHHKALWHYVRVASHRRMTFEKALATGTLDLAEFGEILYSGWGKMPPEEITAKIKTL